MSPSGNSADPIEIVIKAVVDVLAPGVGTLLSFAARQALKQSDEDRFNAILCEAMNFDAKQDDVSKWAIRTRYVNRRRLIRARRQDRLAVATFAPIEKVADRAPQVPSVTVAVLPVPNWESPRSYLLGVARSQLDEAVNHADLTTWTAQLSNRLATHAKQQLERADAEATNWAHIVTRTSDADPSECARTDLVSWAQGVVLRFEIGLVRSGDLSDWVARLDTHDQAAANAEMLAASRGIRVAILLVAGSLLLALPVEVAAAHIF